MICFSVSWKILISSLDTQFNFMCASHSGSFSVWKFYTIGTISLYTIEFLLNKCFCVKVKDSITLINRNPGVQWTGTLWVTTGNAEWVKIGCLVNMVKKWIWRVILELRILTNKGQIPDQGQMRSPPWTQVWTNEKKSGGHAHKRQASDLKVSDARIKIFLSNWHSHSMLTCLNSCHSFNVVHTI